MGKVIVSDIFGRTPALENLAQAIGSVMEIIDPYGGKQMGFHTEPRAYEPFYGPCRNTLLMREILSSRLADIPRVSMLIGFSVGAAAIWGISQTLTPNTIGCAVCFYGSQIRHANPILCPMHPDRTHTPGKGAWVQH
jgi:dienelactone hydrolase